MIGDFGASVANDFLLWDHTESITYTAVAASQSFSVQHACWEVLSQREINGSQGFYTQNDRKLNLGVPAFRTGLKPAEGDHLVDAAGDTWEVLDWSRETFDNVYSLICRKAR